MNLFDKNFVAWGKRPRAVIHLHANAFGNKDDMR